MKNNILNILFITYLLLTATMNTVIAQQGHSVSGHITDAENNEPVPGAAVFFDNTTVGTTTDLDGNYRLIIPGEGSYRLTVQHVGYQTVFYDIEPNTASEIFNVALQSVELEELTVDTRVRFRQADINLFWRTILGKNPSRRTIQATNPETVYYFYNPETKILKVTCREPLQIVNYETGYQIQYVLNYFTHDYNTGFTDWRYQSIFAELEPQNPRQKDTWEKNRKDVYDISLTKFIKSLYNNTLLDDGFLLVNFNLSLAERDELLQTDPLTNIKTVNVHTPVLLIGYGKPVADRDMARLQTLQQNSQQTETQYIPVPGRMPGELDERQQKMNERASTKQMLGTMEAMNRQGKIMNTLQGESIRIFPDGTFTNTLSMGRVDNSESMMGLSMRLPVEYIPDGQTPPSEVIADSMNDFESIVQHFEQQLSVYPQEKIHLHTDRNFYVPGERIWFKAYVTDAATHLHSTRSRYAYVELISPADTLVSRVMIRPENEMYSGHIFLSEIIPEGDYTLRAYTRYMENLGDDYFFKKNIRIGTLTGGNSIGADVDNDGANARVTNRNGQRPEIRNLKSVTRNNDFDVAFFPEGGNLVDGVWCNIALKALNSAGYPETISGEIVDNNGSVIQSVQTFHAGMGVFSIMPEFGKRYLLKCRNGSGLEKQFELPQPDPNACSLTVSRLSLNQRIAVEVRKSANAPDIPCYLLAHCRGTVFYFEAWNPKNQAVVFSEEDLPSGIIQFVLFDKQMNPLSERLVFNKNFDEAKVEFQTDKTSYAIREKINTTLSLTDLSGNLLSGHVSVAVTDDADIAIDSTTTILSSLLLTSELKGYIENPAWYLQDNNQSATALDYLMMTHGWRKYNVPEVAKGNPVSPAIPFQTGQEISGKVRGLLLRPVANSEVLIITEEGNYGITDTDEKGTFMFTDFEYPDSASFMIQALSRRGSSNVEILLDGESFPTVAYAPQSPVKTDNYPSLPPNTFIMKAEQRSRYDEDMQVIHLSEIVVSAPRIDPKEERRLEYWLNRSSDLTLRREDFIQRHPVYSYDILRGIAGVSVEPDGSFIIIRALGVSDEPLIFIDGMQTHYDDFRYLPVDAIESIDVIKGVIGSSLFGVRGAFGAISVVTRMGGEDEREKTNYTVYTPLGYQKPVEFYSPKYETLESKTLTIPDYRTTIFWKPDVVISEEDEEAGFDFYTSDFPTTYSVVIEGLTTDGKIIRQVEKIRVE